MNCIPTGLVNLVDFQGHVIDNSFGAVSPSNPVIGQFFAANDANQQWGFKKTPASNYRIVNGDNVEAALLSYAGSGLPSELRRFAQAAIQTTQSQAVAFNVTCTSANTAIITDAVFGFALTAWAVVSTTTVTPVTYELVDGRPGQTWKLELLD